MHSSIYFFFQGRRGSGVYLRIIWFKGNKTPWLGGCQKLDTFVPTGIQFLSYLSCMSSDCGRKPHKHKENKLPTE